MSIFESVFFQTCKFNWYFLKRIKKTITFEVSQKKGNLIRRVSINIYNVLYIIKKIFIEYKIVKYEK